ncbi:hypothetical protein FAI40_01560 [Acetobacteraceae bacterium]|nr:hypothetical protein FAI40_01560 [Acetobacteraceae bacterium]
MLSRFVHYLCQRTTWLGLIFICLSFSGVYLGVLDEGAAGVLITFSLGMLIPENWPMARKVVNFIAPILVHQIGNHAILKASHPKIGDWKNKKNFKKDALSVFFNSCTGQPEKFREPDQTFKKEKIMEDKNTENTDLLEVTDNVAQEETNPSNASVADVFNQLEEAIYEAEGEKLSDAQKARIKLYGSVSSAIVSSLLGVVGGKFDVQGLLNGISDIEKGVLLQEQGFFTLKAAFKKAA